MLALLKNNTVLNRYDIVGQFPEDGWADLPDGSRVSPAQDGWALRGYELKTIVAADPVPEGFVVQSQSLQIVDGVPKFVNELAAATPYVPPSITRRQFFQVLAIREIITRQEALDAVATGAIPAAMEDLIAMLADDDLQWNARMVISGAKDFERGNWFVQVFGQLRNMTPAEIDALWIDGDALT